MPSLKEWRDDRRAAREAKAAQRAIPLERITIHFPKLNSKKQWYLFGIFIATDVIIVLLLYIWWNAIKQNTNSAWPTIVISLAVAFAAAMLFGLGDAIISRWAHDQYTEEIGDATLTTLKQHAEDIDASFTNFKEEVDARFEHMKGDLDDLKLESNPTEDARKLGLVKVFPRDSGREYHEVLDRLIRGTPELILLLNFDPRWITEHPTAFRSRLADSQKKTIVCLPDLQDLGVARILGVTYGIPQDELQRRQLSIFTRLETLKPVGIANRPFRVLGHVHIHTCQVALGTSQAVVEPYFTVQTDDRPCPAFWYRGGPSENYVARLKTDTVDLIKASRDIAGQFELLASAGASP